jgi:hypothetical protein
LANVGEPGKYSVNGLVNVRESGESFVMGLVNVGKSGIFLKMAFLRVLALAKKGKFLVSIQIG